MLLLIAAEPPARQFFPADTRGYYFPLEYPPLLRRDEYTMNHNRIEYCIKKTPTKRRFCNQDLQSEKSLTLLQAIQNVERGRNRWDCLWPWFRSEPAQTGHRS